MAVQFPVIKPSSRSFTAPKWPITTRRSQSGVLTRRLWGNSSSGAGLSLKFNGLGDAETAKILIAYEAAKGSFDDLIIPSSVLDGLEPELRSIFGSPGGQNLQWRFAEDSPPTVESIYPGRSNVDVSLTATLTLD